MNGEWEVAEVEDSADEDVVEKDEAEQSDPGFWRTKSPEFWAVLSAILVKTRPDTLLELGAGRSTTVLATYVGWNQKRLITFEQSAEWVDKVTEELRGLGFNRKMVLHMPLDESTRPFWYDNRKAKRILQRRDYDFIFIDGPKSHGRRNAEGQKMLSEAALKARIIVVDDLHRNYNREFFHRLTERFGEANRFYFRDDRNQTGFGCTEELAPVIRSCFEFLGMPYAADLPPPTKGLAERDETPKGEPRVKPARRRASTPPVSPP